MFNKILIASVVVLGMTACASTPGGPSAAATDLKPTQGNTANGTVRFLQQGDKVQVQVRVSGLAPNSVHGFHVHEKGDCSAPDAVSAGGHFNPGAKAHAHFDKGDRHAGDLPNLRADASGVASYQFETNALSVGKGDANVIGRSVIVHRDADDYASQPAGNSGPRIACGVIAAK